MHCQRCGREAELRAGTDGGLYCSDCLQSGNTGCTDCLRCSQRYCGITACPFCKDVSEPEVRIFEKKAESAEPIAVREACQRCGSPMERVFVLRGKALCRDCLIAEQDRWEIVPAKPSKSGARVSIVVEKKGLPEDSQLGRRLFRSIGIDPDDPPARFLAKSPISEKKMPDDQCRNCPAYEAGKMSGKFLGKGRQK